MEKTDIIRFDHLLYRELELHGGAFLGERHDAPALRQALTWLMPALRSQGVTTLALEITPAMVEDMLNSSDVVKWGDTASAKSLAQEFKPEEVYHLVKAAQKNGIEVIGYQDEKIDLDFYKTEFAAIKNFVTDLPPDISKKINDALRKGTLADFVQTRKEMVPAVNQQIDRNPELANEIKKLAQPFFPGSHNMMIARNQSAAAFIQAKRKPGKLLVLGGYGHSFYDHAVRHIHAAPLQVAPDWGLDRLLGIPAINFQDSTDIKSIGESFALTPTNDTFATLLPADLKEHMGRSTSWPPRDRLPRDLQSPTILPVPLKNPPNTPQASNKKTR